MLRRSADQGPEARRCASPRREYSTQNDRRLQAAEKGGPERNTRQKPLAKIMDGSSRL